MPRLIPSFFVLAIVAQVVHAGFNFKLSNVSQCEPVQLTFSGSSANNHSVPTFLTVLPLIDKGLPIQIPIPNGATNTTAISLSFIPLPEGSRFIASLDNGVSSDVTKVGPSTAIPADTSCFPSTTLGGPTVSFYDVPAEVDQCEPFNVTFTTPTAPSITAFTPKGNSFNVTLVNPNLGPNTAMYMMNGPREGVIVLLFNDSANNAQTSSLLTIGGDSSSSTSCMRLTSIIPTSNGNPGKSSHGLRRAAIVGITIGSAVLVVASLLAVWYMLRLRRKGRRFQREQPDSERTDSDSAWSGDEIKPEVLEQGAPRPATVYLGAETTGGEYTARADDPSAPRRTSTMSTFGTARPAGTRLSSMQHDRDSGTPELPPATGVSRPNSAMTATTTLTSVPPAYSFIFPADGEGSTSEYPMSVARFPQEKIEGASGA